MMFTERICVATDGSDVAVRAAQLAALSVAQPRFSLAAGLAHGDPSWRCWQSLACCSGSRWRASAGRCTRSELIYGSIVRQDN
jgi:hypothetical protein